MSWWDNLTGKEKAIAAGGVLGLVALIYAVRKGQGTATATPTGPYVLSDVPQGTIPVVGAGGVYPTPIAGPSTPGQPPGPSPTPSPTPTPVPPPWQAHPPNPIPVPPPPAIIVPPEPMPPYSNPPLRNPYWPETTAPPAANQPNVAGAEAFLASLGNINGPMASAPNPNLPPSFFQTSTAADGAADNYTPGVVPILFDQPVTTQAVVTPDQLMGVVQGGDKFDNMVI